MNLARFALRNDKAVVFAVVVLAILGVRAYAIAPQSIFPTMSFSRIDVVADAGDLPPEQVRVAVTRPLEAAFQTLPSVANVVATSSQGTAELFVNFAASTDPRTDLQEVDQAISQTRSDLPAAKNVVAVVVNPNSEPILSFALTSRDLSQAVLRQIATTQIVPNLYGTPGLGKVTVTGGPATEYHVDLDPAKLVAQGIGAADVGKALADANTVEAVGVSQRFYQRYAVLIDASLDDRASLERVAIPTKDGASVPLASLGTVALGTSPATAETSIDGTHAVIVNAYGLSGADTVKMAAAFQSRLAGVVPHLPRDIVIKKFWDQTTLVVESQKALRDAILIGALLAVIVIYAFLRSTRLTLVAAAIIPLAMSIAIFAMQQAGQTLNLMSVGGLAVAVGLIIDDAIVVIENIARNRRERPGLSIDEAVSLSMTQLTGAMTASTTTTVVVFLPLALLTGVTGFFFRALAFTLATSLVVSLGLALLIAPIVARALLRTGEEREHGHDAVAAVLDRYEPSLRWALGHRAVVAAVSVAVLLLTVVLLLRLPSDFLPKLDEGQFEIAYTMPTGTTLAASDAAATTMERIVAADPAVEAVGRLTGIDSNGYTPTQSNQGLLRVRLVPPERRASYDEVSSRLRDRLAAAVPSSLYDFHQILEDLINDLSGTPAPLEITVRGADQATLIALAGRVADKIARVRGVVDAAPGVVYDSPSLRVAPRTASLAALGLTTSDVGDALAALGQGTIATSLPGTQDLIPVRVRVADPSGAGGELVDASTSLFAKGGSTSLGDVATLAPQRLASDVTTENGRRELRVTANIENANLSAVIAGVDAALRATPFPPGYSAEIGGQAQTQKQSFAEFVNVIAIAIALVFAVMLAAFRSFRLPLVILTAIPLALIGVALGLFLTGTPFNVSSFMGLLLLVGVVVKNGILLIDVANRRRAEGATVEEALVAAGRTRLRPIVMTTLAAIGGLFPLALGIGQGAEMEKPLAIAVIGGLSTATFFTLIVIPVLYATFTGGDRSRARSSAAAVALAGAAFALVLPRGASAQALPAPSPPRTLAFARLTIADAESAALTTSPDVAGALARLAQSQAALAAARAAVAPSLTATYVQTPQGNPPGPNITSRQLTTGLQVSLADLFAYGATVREAAFNASAAQFDESAAEAAERVKVVGLYFDALKARAVAAARRDALDSARAQREAARARASAGDAPQLDVIRADVALARAEADLEAATAADLNATEALAVETNVPVAALDATEAADLPAVAPALLDPDAAVALARTARPEIASARRTADAAAAAVRGARAAALPPITVTGGYLVGTDSGVPVNAPAVNAQITLPLSNAGGQRVSLAQARALEAQSKARSVERQIALDVAASSRTLGAAQRAAAADTRARQSAETELHAVELGYRSGASSSLEVTSARSTYAQTVVDELSALYDLEKARATLKIELGT